jgi:hypothetical protein
MQFPRWSLGLLGLIYLPPTGTFPRERNRPYYIVEVDNKGNCIIREGPMGEMGHRAERA